MGKAGKKNKKYSPEFKISVIMDMLKHHLAYRETVRKYWGTTKVLRLFLCDNITESSK